MTSATPPITCHLLATTGKQAPGDHIFYSFHYKTTLHRVNDGPAVSSSELRRVLSLILFEPPATQSFVIVGDASVTPLIQTGQLQGALTAALQSPQSAGIFLLQTGAGLRHGETDLFETAAGFVEPGTTPPGLPAFAVAPGHLGALICALPDSGIPAAQALDQALQCGKLRAMRSRRPCFYQWLAPDPGALARAAQGGEDLALAVCLSSYKRPQDLQRQLFCLLNQTYRNFHLFVAVKGMTPHVFDRVVRPYFREAFEQGLITLRFFPNKNQVSNTIDAIRGLDTEAWDLFVKVDDDELYEPDYLRHISMIHSLLPPGFSSYVHGRVEVMNVFDGFPVMGDMDYHTCGSSLVLSRSVLERMMLCEAEPSRVCELVPTIAAEFRPARFGYCEDQLIRMIMQEHGVANRLPYLHALGSTDHLIIRKGNDSVTRGRLIEDDFKQYNHGIGDDEATREDVLDCAHPQWKGVLRCFRGRARLFPSRDEADILHRSGRDIVLKWDRWGTERFEADEQGIYRLAEES